MKLNWKKHIKEPVILRIYLLLITFLMAIFIVWSIDLFFSSENSKLKNEVANQQQKQKLGNLLQKKLFLISANFNLYPSLSHPKQIENTGKNLENLLNSSHNVINTLENGGTIFDTLQVNFNDADEFVEVISYQQDKSNEFVVEVINIRPKLVQLQNYVSFLGDLVSRKLTVTDPAKIEKLNAEISFEIKQVESILTRTREQGNKIYFDVSNTLKSIENLYTSKLEQWRIYEAFLILGIGFIELLIVIYLISQTRKIIANQRASDKENAQLLHAVENSPVAITITNQNGIIEYVNKHYSTLTGYTKAESLGQDAGMISGVQEVSTVEQDLWATLKNGDTWKGEFVNRKKDETTFISSSVISPIFDENNHITHYISIQEDLTEKKKLESSLQASYETLKEIFDKLPVGVVLIKGKSIFQINTAAAEIMGYDSFEEAVSKLQGKVCHGNYCSVPEGFCPIYDLKGKYFTLQEKQMIGNNGKEISILKSVIPVKIHDDEYLLEAFMDIGAQKSAQEREIEANRAKSEFLANMSHEIRTPMNGIIGAADILSNASLDEDHKFLVKMIQNSSETLLNIINDILDFSKIEAGKLEIDNYSFNIHETIENIVDQFAIRAATKNINLYHLISNDIPGFIFGDEGRLMQVLINLVGNAIKFTHEGHVFLRVEKMGGDDDKQVKIRFSIEDTGIGIPHDRIEKIFEAFTQADGSTIRKYGGTGLGTTISRMLVDLMGGEIVAESPNPRLDKNTTAPGSVFHVFLSFKIDTVRNSHTTSSLPDLSNFRTVVLTDDETSQCISREMFKNLGIPVQLFNHPDQIVEYFQNLDTTSRHHHLLILDQDAPQMSAFESVKNLTDKKLIEGVKVILTTTHLLAPDKKECSENNIDACLMKPVNQTKLQKTIIKLLAQPIPEAESVKAVSDSKPKPSDIKILLAEDNVINQKIAKQTFNNLGFQIDIVDNGRMAVEAVKSGNFQFVFMDIMMPEMNGLDATREIRKFNQSVKIIAMTANAMKGDRENCLNSGMDDYISKPFKMKDVNEILSKWIEGSGEGVE